MNYDVISLKSDEHDHNKFIAHKPRLSINFATFTVIVRCNTRNFNGCFQDEKVRIPIEFFQHLSFIWHFSFAMKKIVLF